MTNKNTRKEIVKKQDEGKRGGKSLTKNWWTKISTNRQLRGAKKEGREGETGKEKFI